MNKKQNLKSLPAYLWVLGVICVILLIATVIAAIVAANREPEVQFIPPAFESAAEAGMPQVPQGLGWEELHKDEMNFSVYICGSIALEDGAAVVYFTNPEANDVWLKLRICDEEGKVLGETGLLKPGEYLRAVPLVQETALGTPVKIRIMGYEPQTYMSRGSISVNTVVGS